MEKTLKPLLQSRPGSIRQKTKKVVNSIFVTIVDVEGAEKCDLRIEPEDTVLEVKIKVTTKLNTPPYSNHEEPFHRGQI